MDPTRTETREQARNEAHKRREHHRMEVKRWHVENEVESTEHRAAAAAEQPSSRGAGHRSAGQVGRAEPSARVTQRRAHEEAEQASSPIGDQTRREPQGFDPEDVDPRVSEPTHTQEDSMRAQQHACTTACVHNSMHAQQHA